MKKITSIVLSVSMAAGALGMNTAVVHAEESAKKVAYISAANQFDFFVYIGAEIKKVGEENGVQVDMFDAALDVSKEADLMSQAILQKYDAIIVGPVDTQALIPSIKEANEAGIPVINYDSFIEGAEVYARVGSGNKDMGNCSCAWRNCNVRRRGKYCRKRYGSTSSYHYFQWSYHKWC